MIGKVKQWLGIEGVKIELVVPDKIKGADGVIEGKIKFHTMHSQRVKSVKLTLYEKYTRGRFKNKLSDLYKIAEHEQEENIIVNPGEVIEIDFELPFSMVKSDMDEISDKNIILRKLVDGAKFLKNVKSEYTLEAEAV